MFIECPKCRVAQSVEYKQVEECPEIECVDCHSKLNIKIIAETREVSKEDHAHCPDNVGKEKMPKKIGTQKSVLVCIDGEGSREIIKALLGQASYKMFDIPSGISAAISMKTNTPDIALIDAGYTDMPGIELCAQIKGNPDLREIPVILVGSMFDKNTKYREGPPPMCGADDYIYRRGIQKELLTKIETLLEIKSKTPVGIREKGVHSDQEPEIMKTEAHPEPVTDIEQDEQALKNAKRLAKVIISDIVLYNKEKVEKGIRTGTFHELLDDELMEGRRLFEKRAPAYFDSSIFEDTIENYIKKSGDTINQSIDPKTDPPVENIIQEENVMADLIPDSVDPETEAVAVEDPFAPEVEISMETSQDMESLAKAAIQSVAGPESAEDSLEEPLLETKEPNDMIKNTEDQAELAIQNVLEPEMGTPSAPEGITSHVSDAIKSAKRLAKVIVSDITIYNENKVEKGLRNGTFYEVLKDEIKEGRDLYDSKVSKTLVESDVFEAELEAFIKRRTGRENQKEAPPQEPLTKEAPPQEPFTLEKKSDPVQHEQGSVEEPKEDKAAKRLAKIIVSDIVIYNEKKVSKGLETGSFYRILEDEISEGQKLYKSRVSHEILETKNYYKEAFEAFIQKRSASSPT